MRRRADRYAMELMVDLFAGGDATRVRLRDLSRSGMFLRVSPPPAVGTLVHVAMYFEGRELAMPARVVHGLTDVEARALGRRPGIGIAFDPPTRHADTLFMRAVDRLIAGRARVDAIPVHVVVADPSTRILERLSAELGEAGCTVGTASNGLEAIGACLRRVPDVVVVDRALPVLDGFQLVTALAAREALAHVPVIVMTGDPDEILIAFERGAKDVIHKPFTGGELAARCRHVIGLGRKTRRLDRVIMRNDLAQVSLPAVLVMLEQERKTCRISLTGPYPAWLELVDGCIVAAGSTAHDDDVQTIVMALLDWRVGELEIVATTSSSRRGPAMPITYLLLEHARRTDERNYTRN
jgi:CheY-like chemotaxis protein